VRPLLWIGTSLVLSGYFYGRGMYDIRLFLSLFEKAFFNYYGLAVTIIKAGPILFCALAVILPLRVGLINIGGEGQMYLGGLGATITALNLPENVGSFGIILCTLIGALSGVIYALIPGILLVRFTASEVLTSLFLNYIAIDIVSYIVSGPLMAVGAPYPYTDKIPSYLQLPKLLPGTDAHGGVIVAVLFAMMVYVLFRYSVFGFECLSVGRSPVASLYAGINVTKCRLVSLGLGGACAGIAGAFEVIGLKYRLFDHFVRGYGFDGVVAAFLGAGHPMLTCLSSFLLAAMESGANMIQRDNSLSIAEIELFKGCIVMGLGAFLFRTRRSKQ